MERRLNVDPWRLEQALAAIIAAIGSAPAEAEAVARHLVEANLKGHESHGIAMLPSYASCVGAGSLRPNRRGRILRDDGAFMLVDGEHGYGQRVARDWTGHAIERARKSGVCVYGIRAAHHMGRIGAYAEQCLAAGMAVLLFVNVIGRPLVAAHGGTRARLGTNPICIGIPGGDGERAGPDLLLDFATSGIAAGKARVAWRRGEPIAAGFLLDADGRQTTDPGVMYRAPQGALLPLGGDAGHKGFGLALVAEVLAGIVVGGGTMAERDATLAGTSNSLFGIVFDPGRLGDGAGPLPSLAALVEYLRADEASGASAIVMPGEPERALARQRATAMPVDADTWRALLELADAAGISRALLQFAIVDPPAATAACT